MDAAALLDAFAAHERGLAGLSAQTVRNHRLFVAAYLRWWAETGRGDDVRAAGPGELAAFLLAEHARGLAPATRRGELAALRRFYRFLAPAGADPTAGVAGPRVPAAAVSTYSPAQAAAILGHTAGLADRRGRQRHAIVAALRYTGMRSGELRTLSRADVHLADGVAYVTGKGPRQRAVLLPPPLVDVLAAFLAEVRPALPDSPLLLANPHPYVLTPLRGFGQETLAREVELAGLGAGVPGRHHPHKWRHTFATELLRAGVDLHAVQRLLGHASVVSTVGYTHLVLDDLRRSLGAVWG